MVSMMGGRHGRNVLEFLSYSDKAQTVIRTHNEAVRSHAIAADNFKKKKTEAENVIAQLAQKQLEHDKRELDLNTRSTALKQLNEQLNVRERDLAFLRVELEAFQEALKTQQGEHQHRITQFNNSVSQKETLIRQKIDELSRKDKEAQDKILELKSREEAILAREQAVIALADTLR